MAIYNRNDSNLPQVAPPTQLANKELGDIIIKSFGTVTEALSGGDVPVNEDQIEKAVTKGINKSILGKWKNGMGGVSVQQGTKTDDAVSSYYEQKKYLEWEKHEKARIAEEQNAIKERERKVQENIDKTFQKVNEFSNNPLKGVSDLFDKGVKALFKNTEKVLNTPLADVPKKFTDAGTKALGVITSPWKAVGKGISGVATAGATVGKLFTKPESKPEQDLNLDSLIEDEGNTQKEKPAVGKVKGQPDANSLNLDSLVQADDKQEEDEKKAEDDKKEKKHDKQADEQKKATVTVGGAVGKIALGLVTAGLTVAGISVALIEIGGHFSKFVADFPTNLNKVTSKVEAKMAALISGPNCIGNQIKWSVQEVLIRLGLAKTKLSDDEQKRLKALTKNPDAKLAGRTLNDWAKAGVDIQGIDWQDDESVNEGLESYWKKKGFTDEQINHMKTNGQFAQSAQTFKGIMNRVNPDDLEEIAELESRNKVKLGTNLIKKQRERAKVEGVEFEANRYNDNVAEGLVNRYNKGKLTEYEYNTMTDDQKALFAQKTELSSEDIKQGKGFAQETKWERNAENMKQFNDAVGSMFGNLGVNLFGIPRQRGSLGSG